MLVMKTRNKKRIIKQKLNEDSSSPRLWKSFFAEVDSDPLTNMSVYLNKAIHGTVPHLSNKQDMTSGLNTLKHMYTQQKLTNNDTINQISLEVST